MISVIFSTGCNEVFSPRPVLSFSRKTHTLIPKNDVTEPKVRLL